MERHFSEQQVSDIIKRAADFQLRERVATSDSPDGVSESELRKVAKELGVNDIALDEAIGEVDRVTSNDSGSITSIKRSLTRTFDREFSDEDLAIVTEEFPPLQGIGGGTFTLGKTIQYRSVFGVTACHISISRRKGKTEIKVKSDAGIGAVLFAASIPISLFSVLIGAFEYGSSSPGSAFALMLLLPAVLILGSIAGSRKIQKSVNSKLLDAVDAAMAKLLELDEE